MPSIDLDHVWDLNINVGDLCEVERVFWEWNWDTHSWNTMAFLRIGTIPGMSVHLLVHIVNARMTVPGPAPPHAPPEDPAHEESDTEAPEEPEEESPDEDEPPEQVHAGEQAVADQPMQQVLPEEPPEQVLAGPPPEQAVAQEPAEFQYEEDSEDF